MRARCLTFAARAARATACARATTRARSSSRRPSPASSTPPAASRASRFQAEERDVGELSLALGRGGDRRSSRSTAELATLEDLFFRLTEGAAHAGGAGPTPAEGDSTAAPQPQAAAPAQVG